MWRTFTVILERLFEVSEVPVLVRTSDGTHALDILQLGVFGHKLD